jgi:predicted enzyme related to lactoylglutathione lyase
MVNGHGGGCLGRLRCHTHLWDLTGDRPLAGHPGRPIACTHVDLAPLRYWAPSDTESARMPPPTYAEVVYLENVVVDAINPQALGRFWETVLGTETLTDEFDGFETRLAVPDGPVLDLCFQRVPEPPVEPQRLHLDLRGAEEQPPVVDRLLALGASHADMGQGQVPWVVLADPEGNEFCVLEERAACADAGPIAALRLDVADLDREHDFWLWLTGWVPVEGSGRRRLQHSSHRGPLLALCPEVEPKGPAKNRMHVDLRLEPGDNADAAAQGIVDRGGRELHPGWGDLPWRHFADPSGNEFCVLPSRG